MKKEFITMIKTLNKENKNNSGIYEIVNLLNGKKYIGKATTFHIRANKHVSDLRYNRDSIYLQNSYNKYGKENFEYRIIEECDKELLNDREVYWIAYYNTFLDKSKGYNLTPGGDGGTYGENNGMYGKSVHEVWVEKYGIEEADRLWKESNLKRREKSKEMWKRDGYKEKYSKENSGVNSCHYGNKKLEESIEKGRQTQIKNGKSLGKNNPMYGKSVYDVWVEKYGKEEADKKKEIMNLKKCKLSVTQMEEVKHKFLNKENSVNELSKIYSVSKKTISNIISKCQLV